MNTRGREQVGTHVTDNLIAGNRHPVDVCLVMIKEGQKLERGSVLAEETEGAGKYVLLGDGTQQAEYILADDVDAAEGEAAGTAYRAGEFAENALIMAEGYELTEKDRKALRDAGIFLSTIMM